MTPERNNRAKWHYVRVAVERGPGDDPNISEEELLRRRNAWFESYTAQRSVSARRDSGPYTCPCCGHLALAERGGYEICGECGWEDDGQDDHDADVVRGGPNGRLSLTQARLAYVSGGGWTEKHAPPSQPQ